MWEKCLRISLTTIQCWLATHAMILLSYQKSIVFNSTITNTTLIRKIKQHSIYLGVYINRFMPVATSNPNVILFGDVFQTKSPLKLFQELLIRLQLLNSTNDSLQRFVNSHFKWRLFS